MRFLIGFAVVAAGFVHAADPANEFATSIRPVLMQNCAACHNPEGRKGSGAVPEDDRSVRHRCQSRLVAQRRCAA